MSKKFSITGTGDSLFVAPFPENYNKNLKEMQDFFSSCDVSLTNLETNLSDFEFAGNAYSGGTWINTKREYLNDLEKFGFDYYGTANNHAMDYGHEGLLSTIDELDRRGHHHSGSGRSLEEAGAPAVFTKNGVKIAVFAVDASCKLASKAGNSTPDIKARPGVNYLRHSESFYVTEEQMDSLKEIAESTKLNFLRNFIIETGYGNPDPEGVFVFGEKTFTTDKNAPATSCNKVDLARILEGIKKAKAENDYVILLVHCHDCDNTSNANPPEYLREFCKKCIDAGVSAVFGGGCHELRGIEIYNNAPIFYSLGDFVYQGMRVELLPAEFMEQFNAPLTLSAYDALYLRSRGGTVGLHTEEKNYQSLLPKIEFEDGKMTSVTLQPIYLNFNEKDFRNGLPRFADQKEAEEILEIVNRLSEPFGTQFKNENGSFVIK